MADFNQRIRQRLENHRLPVDEGLWEAIEHQMAASGGVPKKRVISPYYWLIGMGVAAAAVALLLLITPFSEQPGTNRGMVQRQEHQHLVHEFVSSIAATEKPASSATHIGTKRTNYSLNPMALNSTTAGNVVFSQKTPTKTGTSKVIHDESGNSESEYVAENTVSNLSDKPHSTIEEAGNQSLDNGEGQTKTDEKKPQQGSHSQIDRLPDLNDYPEITPRASRTKVSRKVSLAAAFRTGGRITVDKGINAPRGPLAMKKAPRTLVSKEITDNYIGILKASDYSNAVHQPPISAGVSVDIPLNKRLSIETGLIYTYLKSDFKKSTGASLHYNGTLQLHYLGIPINFRVKVLDRDSWNVYIAAGAMAEKGLLSLYDQEARTANSELYKRQTTVKSSIDGIQLSMHGSIGAEYKLNRHIGFFLEPKVIYYFENNQPMSARSEHPLNIGISCGIRFGL